MFQRTMRFEIPAELNLSTRQRVFETKRVNGKLPTPQSEQKQFADLLKRLARRVMQDLTECPPHAIPHHVIRLDDLREIITHKLRGAFRETPEAVLSGVQLLRPTTLADYLAAMDITRQQHRAPVFLNSRDEDFQQIKHMICTLAGQVNELTQAAAGREVAMPETFQNVQGESERV